MLRPKKVAIMQPYFMAYIGYFQLIKSCDFFILYDTQYTKKGWINRNNILANGKSLRVTLPIKNASLFQSISKRELSSQYDRVKFLKKILFPYSKAPQFHLIKNIIEEIIMCQNNNLFCYISNSIEKICNYLDLDTKIISSNLINPYPLKDNCDPIQDKIISLIKAVEGTAYINTIGGLNLYSKEYFGKNCIDLHFIKPIPVNYYQNNSNFLTNLSIIDVMMFNEKEKIKDLLLSYEIV